jgi:hypothetical protein
MHTYWGTDVMSANPITSPKIAIVASLLMGGMLTIAALELRPDGREVSNDQAGVESRATPAPSSRDSPAPSAVATGSVSSSGAGYAAVAQVLDAVQFCLDRNDLESAKVLLEAELALHKDDPRVLTLQRELQTREAAMGSPPAVAQPVAAPAVPLPPRVAAHSASRAEHSRFAPMPAKAPAAISTRDAQTKYAPQGEAATTFAQRIEAPIQPAASMESNTAPPSIGHVEQPVVAPPQASEPFQDALAVVQSASVPQPVQPETALEQAGQRPKTRAEVRMELERARSDGDLPRFGNPDPAGPGGALSMTVNPGAPSH